MMIKLRGLAVIGHDVMMAMLACEVAIYVRYILQGDQVVPLFLWEATLLFGLAALIIFPLMGLHRGLWHYASFNDLLTIVKSVSLTVGLFILLLFLVTRLDQFPRSAVFIIWPLAAVLLGAPRILYRFSVDGNLKQLFERANRDSVPVLLFGAGDAAELFMRQMSRRPVAPYRVLGLVTRERIRVGSEIRGARILGHVDDLDAVLAKLKRSGKVPEKIIVTEENFDGETIRNLVDRADAQGLSVGRLPTMTNLQSEADVSIRPIDVSDLLGRPQKKLDRQSVNRLISGKRVLVTGAGGTIGSELTRQIATIGPEELAVLDNSEFNLYEIDGELAQRFPDLPRRTFMGDVRNRAWVGQVFSEFRPQIVCHAAARKHVPLSEENPADAVTTNVAGSVVVADAVCEHGIETMVMVSTDKAVNPTNVMGASKRAAELYVQAISVADPDGPDFVTVRFGNVLGSSGSVVPLFQKQLAEGGPLTVTHPEITRYFMTVKEAVELILQAAALERDSVEKRAGKIFVLDMGEPVLIRDLAARMIRLAGLEPEKDIEIVYTGLRPAEKLYEELFLEQELLVETGAEGIQLAAPRLTPLNDLKPQLDELISTAAGSDPKKLIECLSRIVPEFEHRKNG